MKLSCPQTFVSQIWRQLVFILLLTQIIVIAAFFLISAVHVGTRLGTNASSLLRVIDIVSSQANPEVTKQVYEALNTDAFLKLTIGRVENTTEQIPYYPALLSAAKTVEQLYKGNISISYQADPVPMIWVQKNEPPLFSLGIPFVAGKYIQHFSLATLFIQFIAMLFMAWWVAKRISTPLLKLSEDAKQMGKNKKINYIAPDPHSCTEIITLADALNKMRADINKMIKQRESYLAEISHDLRTPLSRLRMAVEMFNPDSSTFIEGLKEDIQEMNIILKQAIDLECSDIDENELWVEGDINQLLSEVQNKYQRAGVSLQLDLATMPTFRFKSQALTRLLYNFIDNGLQHAVGSQVSLGSRMDGDIPAIVVVNTGGDSCDKADSCSSEALGAKVLSNSNGMGLLIVQRIADMHGATVKTIDMPCTGGREVVISFAAP